ncbi:hypothetical protein ACHAXM_006741 [Skeletonema potamos]|jgi:hypothetical protein
MLSSSIITDDEDNNSSNATGRITIRKRAAADRSNLHSSMVTVPEDFATSATANLADNDHDAENNNSNMGGPSTSRGSMLDDSVRSEHSLVHKMQSALNEEWWTKRQEDWREHKATPVKAVLQTEEDKRLTRSQSKQQLMLATSTTKKRTRRADFVFGVLLLAVGFVVGGVFIHRDKIMAEMSSLMGGSSSSSSSNESSSRAEQRQLPLNQDGMASMTYEQRQQFYRQQRQAGMLRQSQQGQYVINWGEQHQRYQDDNQFHGERH